MTKGNPDSTVRLVGREGNVAEVDADGRVLVSGDGGVGGGLTDAELRASPVDVDATPTNRFVGGKTPVCATVTDAGDTVVHTPAAGNAIRLYWVSAINDPDESTTPLIKISIGALECYRAFAVAHWEPFEGEPDEELVVNLSAAGVVAVTAHIEEITP